MFAKIWRKGNPTTVLSECKLVQPLSKIVYTFLKKLKISSDMTQQVHSWVYIYLGKKSKSTNPKLYKHPNVHRDIIIAKVWKQPKCPSQIKYMCIHIHAMEYYSVIKKEWHFAICSNMDGLGGHHAKWNRSDIL